MGKYRHFSNPEERRLYYQGKAKNRYNLLKNIKENKEKRLALAIKQQKDETKANELRQAIKDRRSQ